MQMEDEVSTFVFDKDANEEISKDSFKLAKNSDCLLLNTDL